MKTTKLYKKAILPSREIRHGSHSQDEEQKSEDTLLRGGVS